MQLVVDSISDVSELKATSSKRIPVTILSSLMQTSHLPSSEVSHNALHNPLQNTFLCPRATGQMAKTRTGSLMKRPLHTFKSRKSHIFFPPFSSHHVPSRSHPSHIPDHSSVPNRSQSSSLDKQRKDQQHTIPPHKRPHDRQPLAIPHDVDVVIHHPQRKTISHQPSLTHSPPLTQHHQSTPGREATYYPNPSRFSVPASTPAIFAAVTAAA
jgi:hypothetical protein